jgi:hypothetical protein
MQGAGRSNCIFLLGVVFSAVACGEDRNTLILTTPALSSGLQQLLLSNPGGGSVSLDTAFLTH